MLVLVRRWLANWPGAKKLPDCRVPGRDGIFDDAGYRGPGDGTLVLLASCLLFQPVAGPELKQVRRVAVFYEVGSFFSRCCALRSRDARCAGQFSPYQIELYPEYLETTLFDDPAEQQQFRESYIRKYQNRRPDLIIALGPSPLRFMVDAHEKFFADIPIVFGGTSEQQADNPTLDSHFTGCWASFEPAKTLDVALRLQPGSRHVVVVGGMSIFRQTLGSNLSRASP